MRFLAILLTTVCSVALTLQLLILLMVPKDSVSPVGSVFSVGSVCSQLTDVESVPSGTLQFSTSVLYVSRGCSPNSRLVGWLVSWLPIFQENRSKDFSDFLHECSLP